jgi:hypothetical protein
MSSPFHQCRSGRTDGSTHDVLWSDLACLGDGVTINEGTNEVVALLAASVVVTLARQCGDIRA